MNSTRTGSVDSPVNGWTPEAQPVAALEQAGHEPLVDGFGAVEELVQVGGELDLGGLVGLVGGNELGEAVTATEVVGGILAHLRFDNARPATSSSDGHGDGSGVRLSRGVLVGDHYDVGVRQVLGVVVAPLASTAGGAGGDDARCLEGVDVLLAFGDPHGCPVVHSRDDLRQSVKDAAGVAELP
jgi:hypothetical protein